MMKQPNSNASEEHSLCIFSQPNEKQVVPPGQSLPTAAVQLSSGDLLTLEEVGVALEAIQRLNSKLETENASLKERLGLLDQLVVKLLKRNEKLNKP